MRAPGRILLGFTLAAGFVVLAGSAAGAQTRNQARPADATLGDPVGTNVSPHGGYSAATNMCRTCHSLHGTTNPYALMWKNSVTETCQTCHGLFGADPTGGRTSYTGDHNLYATASTRTAYEYEGGAEHGIGATVIDHSPGTLTESGWSYGWNHPQPPGSPPGAPSTNSATAAGPGTSSAGAGGLYCGSCHTPHGDFGQLVNNWKSPDDDGREIRWDPAGSRSWTLGYLHLDTTRANADRSSPGVWQACTDPAGTVACEDVLVDDEDGSTSGDPAYLYGYKLLSKNPNHTYSVTQSYKTQNRGADIKGWCTSCHSSVIASETSHPHATACTYCHGNPADPDYTATKDFPHTSSMSRMLKLYPDELCLSCHLSGALP